MLSKLFRPFALLAALLGGPLSAAETPLILDSVHSHIEVAVKASLHSFTARLNTFDPRLAIDDAGKIAAASVSFHFRDLFTGKADRDKQMHAWQQTDAHPDAAFKLTALEPAAAGTFHAVGQLTFHGVTRELRFPATVTHDGPLYAIDGDAPFDTRDFGLPVIRMFGVLKVDPIVHVRFHLQARKTP
jgi:polyisoprenoid-binding protein YceI